MEPTTELDQRFSEPGAIATDWGEVRDVLASAETFWIATVRRDGRPHVTPLVAVWLDEALFFCTGPQEQKAVNLRDNQQVILSTGCNQWDAGLDVIVGGHGASHHRRNDTPAPRSSLADEVGRPMALRGRRRGVSP